MSKTSLNLEKDSFFSNYPPPPPTPPHPTQPKLPPQRPPISSLLLRSLLGWDLIIQTNQHIVLSLVEIHSTITCLVAPKKAPYTTLKLLYCGMASNLNILGMMTAIKSIPDAEMCSKVNNEGLEHILPFIQPWALCLPQSQQLILWLLPDFPCIIPAPLEALSKHWFPKDNSRNSRYNWRRSTVRSWHCSKSWGMDRVV